VRGELEDLAGAVKRLSRALSARGADGRAAEDQVVLETTLIYASASEKVYLGFERVMKIIVADIDGDPVKDRDGWHKALVRRLSEPYLDRRGPVLSARTAELIDGLRSFRHRARNSYGIDLDLAAVAARAFDTIEAFGLFEDDVTRFFEMKP
jgi:hypothetical protein